VLFPPTEAVSAQHLQQLSLKISEQALSFEPMTASRADLIKILGSTGLFKIRQRSRAGNHANLQNVPRLLFHVLWNVAKFLWQDAITGIDVSPLVNTLPGDSFARK